VTAQITKAADATITTPKPSIDAVVEEPEVVHEADQRRHAVVDFGERKEGGELEKGPVII
jgi:hypothetical protein